MADPSPVPLAPTSPTPADPQHTMNRTADSGVELTSPELSPQPLQSQISSPDVLSPSEAGLELEERLITAENEPEVRTDVVRESDQAEEELPGEGFAKNLLSKFQNMEVEAKLTKQKEHKPSGAASRPVGPVVQHDRAKIDASHFVNPESDDENFGAPGGVYESQPVLRDDVAREDQSKDDEELPPAGVTKNLLSAFRDMQRSNETSPVRSRTLSRVDSTSSMPSSLAESLSLFSQSSGAYSENTPLVRDDVAKESDQNEIENLPAQGTTKNLLSMFSKVSEDTKKMTQKLHKPSGLGTKQWQSKKPPVMTRPSQASKARSEPDSEQSASTEIAREEPGTVNEEELPKSGFAKGLLNKFKSIEAAAPASSKPIHMGSKKVVKQAWCADVVKAKRDNSNSPVNHKPNQVKTEEITQPVSPTINANNNNAVDSDPSNTQSALPADKYENTVEKPSQETTTEQIFGPRKVADVVRNGHSVDSKVEQKSKPTTDTKEDTTKPSIYNKEETVTKSTSSKPQPSSAMAKFMKMESEKPKVIEHKPSKAASKSLRDKQPVS